MQQPSWQASGPSVNRLAFHHTPNSSSKKNIFPLLLLAEINAQAKENPANIR